MDWASAIARNRDALRAIIAALFAQLGLEDGGSVRFIPRPLHRAVLRLLQPAESAVRRLIVIAARGLTVTLAPARPKPKAALEGKSGGSRRSAFPLFDARKRFTQRRGGTGLQAEPRVHFFDSDWRVTTLSFAPKPKASPAPPKGHIDARRLCLRLHALKRALADIPGQAKRLARWWARRQAMASPKFTSPLRPGPPPGHRKMASHAVDFVLRECHELAFDALKPDTS